MKKVFFIFILLFSTHNAISNVASETKLIINNSNVEYVNFFENLSGPRYTCTITYRDEYGNTGHSTATSETSAMDACNKALRHTQTNDAIEE